MSAKNESGSKQLRSCLLAVYDKTGLQPLAATLHGLGVKLYATSGTCAYLMERKVAATDVSSLTQYPELLGGRVKTLHPKVFGGLLYRSQEASDRAALQAYDIPRFDMLVVNLYPFEAALQAGEDEAALIEQIDIGGVALLRAAAKNFAEIWVLSSPTQYKEAQHWLEKQGAVTTLPRRRLAALRAFHCSVHYDSQIFDYFNSPPQLPVYVQSINTRVPLRYGENPHQRAAFYGNLDQNVELYQGKSLSYNNLLDVDAALELLRHLGDEKAAFVVIKHSNPCGVAIDSLPERAFEKAYSSDSLSAFGGVFATNRPLSAAVAQRMTAFFFEVLVAPDFSPEALHIFDKYKNRRLLRLHQQPNRAYSYRSALDGMLEQEMDPPVRSTEHWSIPTTHKPDTMAMADLHFAHAVVACARSNAIVLARGGQLMGCGAGQTSRIDALQLAIEKAQRAKLSLQGAVMASEAFFPFADCVEVAHRAGIRAIIQPGGSKNDNLSIEYCETHGLVMVLTRKRHFRH